MKKIYPISMIMLGLLYGLSVLVFLITKTEVALTIWEIVTILSAIYFAVFYVYLMKKYNVKELYRKIVLVFLIALTCFTSVAHASSLLFTRPMIASGINVPDFYLIGKWPSIEMIIDYIGWGLSLGIAYIIIGIGIDNSNKNNKIMKCTMLISGIMCLVGFIGGLTPIQSLWYIASIAYGFGPIITSIFMLIKKW